MSVCKSLKNLKMACPCLFSCLLISSQLYAVVLFGLAVYLFMAVGQVAQVIASDPLPEAVASYAIGSLGLVLAGTFLIIAALLLGVRAVLLLTALTLHKPHRLAYATSETLLAHYGGKVRVQKGRIAGWENLDVGSKHQSFDPSGFDEQGRYSPVHNKASAAFHDFLSVARVGRGQVQAVVDAPTLEGTSRLKAGGKGRSGSRPAAQRKRALPPARIVPSVHGPPPKLNLRTSDNFVPTSISPSVLEKDKGKARIVPSVHGSPTKLNLRASENPVSELSSPSTLNDDEDKDRDRSYMRIVPSVHGHLPDLGLMRSRLQLSPRLKKDKILPRPRNVVETRRRNAKKTVDQDKSSVSSSAPDPEHKTRIVPSVHGPPPELNLRSSGHFALESRSLHPTAVVKHARPPARIVPSVHGPPPKLNLRASDNFVAGSSSPFILEEDTDKGSNQSYTRVVPSVHGRLPDLGLTRSRLQISPGSKKDYKTLLRQRAFNVVEPGLSDTKVVDQDESTVSGSARQPEDKSRQKTSEEETAGSPEAFSIIKGVSSSQPTEHVETIDFWEPSGQEVSQANRLALTPGPGRFAATGAIGNVRKNERATVTAAVTIVNVVEKYGE